MCVLMCWTLKRDHRGFRCLSAMENLGESRHISQTHITAFRLLSMEQRDYPEKQKEGAALYQEMKLPQLTSHTIENWGNKQTSTCLSLIRTLQHDQTNYKVVWEIKCYFTGSIVTLIDDLRKEEKEKWIWVLSYQYLSQCLIFGYA